MKRLSYWLSFSLVAIPMAFGLATWVLSLAGIPVPLLPFMPLLSSFSSPVPLMFSFVVPSPILLVIGLLMLFLVLRRLWLLAFRGFSVPSAYRGFQMVLGIAGSGFLLAGLALLLLSILLKAGSGVPAGLLMVPATLCVPWAILITELVSLREWVVRRGA